MQSSDEVRVRTRIRISEYLRKKINSYPGIHYAGTRLNFRQNFFKTIFKICFNFLKILTTFPRILPQFHLEFIRVFLKFC